MSLLPWIEDTAKSVCVHIYIFQRDDMDMDTKMTTWWNFDRSQPFFSLTSITLPALLSVVLMVLGGLAYMLQVLAEGLKFIYMGLKIRTGLDCNEIGKF